MLHFVLSYVKNNMEKYIIIINADGFVFKISKYLFLLYFILFLMKILFNLMKISYYEFF